MQPSEIADPCATRACLAPHAVNARICTTHTDQLAHALRDVVRVEDDLDTMISRQDNLAEHTGGGHPAERPLPFSWTGAAAAEALTGTLTTWARHVAQARGLRLDLDRVVVPPPPRHARAHLAVVAPTARPNRAHPVAGSPLLDRPIVAPEVDHRDRPVSRRHDDPAQLPYRPGRAARAAQWLLNHLALVVAHPDVAQLVDGVTHIAGRTQHVVDRAPTRWYLGLCDWCERPLYARPEATFTCCRNPDCTDEDDRPRVYQVADRRAWLLDAAQHYMVTAAEASRAVPLLANPGTPFVYSTFRGRLGLDIPADRTHPDGRPRYRLGDCIRWAHDRATAAAEGRPPPERVA